MAATRSSIHGRRALGALVALCVLLPAGVGLGGRKNAEDARKDVQQAQVRRWVQHYEKRARHFPFYLAAARCDQLEELCTEATGSPACLGGLTAFSRLHCKDDTRQLALTMTDAEYHAALKDRFDGQMMALPPVLRHVLLSSGGKVARLKSAARNRGWKTLEYNSRSVANPPSFSHRRLLILRQEEGFDQWIQFTVDKKDREKVEQNVDMIAVQKADENGKELAVPRTYFTGYWRDREAHAMTQKGARNSTRLSRCRSCHVSGPRQLFPAWTHPRQRKSLRAMNQAMEDYGYSTLGEGYPAESDGPIYGAVEPRRPRNARFFKGCAPRLSRRSQARVREAMQCASCHNGTDRGLLNAGTALDQIAVKILDDRQMPPDTRLTRTERKALFECLKDEYAGELSHWLRAQLKKGPDMALR